MSVHYYPEQLQMAENGFYGVDNIQAGEYLDVNEGGALVTDTGDTLVTDTGDTISAGASAIWEHSCWFKVVASKDAPVILDAGCAVLDEGEAPEEGTTLQPGGELRAFFTVLKTKLSGGDCIAYRISN